MTNIIRYLFWRLVGNNKRAHAAWNFTPVSVQLNGAQMVWLKSNSGTGPLMYRGESYAHVMKNGTIRRDGEVIGAAKDLS
jgi:hypothetical protein